ncbi:MAG: SdrD B-like domain-containing protein, partial [Candidatus Kariarchaeaceae archaeon]
MFLGRKIDIVMIIFVMMIGSMGIHGVSVQSEPELEDENRKSYSVISTGDQEYIVRSDLDTKTIGGVEVEYESYNPISDLYDGSVDWRIDKSSISDSIALNLISAQETGALIWTDKADYTPGEIVTIFGLGFDADTSIDVNVTRPNSEIESGTTISNSTGHFVYLYDLNGIKGLYNVSATDGTNTAYTSFTDAVQVNWLQGQNDQNNDNIADVNVTWANGDMNAQNSIITEGNIIPDYPPNIPGHVNYRAIVAGLDPGIYNLTIDYRFSKGGKIAFDFLTTNYGISDASLLNELPNFGPDIETIISDLIKYNLSEYQLPYDDFSMTIGGGSVKDRQVKHENIFQDFNPRVMKVYGATIEIIVQEDHDGLDTDTASSASILIKFNKTSSNHYPIMVTWGGHLGIGAPAPEGYGEGNGAASISGAPYHMSLEGLINATSGEAILSGSRDRSIQPAAIFLPANITGYKWHDLNADGNWDGNEPGLEGWQILINSSDGTVSRSITTDETGFYKFEGLPAGTYNVTEVLQDGWTNTTSTQITIVAAEGDDISDNNFGNTQGRIISGYKWEDLDGDGIWDPGELALNDWTIYLFQDDTSRNPANAYATALTGNNTAGWADGYYEFTVIESGTYYIRENLQAGWTNIYPGEVEIGLPTALTVSRSNYTFTLNDLIASPSLQRNNNFSNFQWFTLTVYKYTDVTGDGWSSDDTLLSGWSFDLELDGSHFITFNDTDDGVSDGVASIVLKQGGSYKVTEVLQSGYTQTGITEYPFTGISGADRGVDEYNFTNFEWFT